MSVYIDITEFLNNPVLTGIQRVTAEICRCWPTGSLRPARLGKSGDLVELPAELIATIAACFRDKDGTAGRAIRALREQTGRRIEPSPNILVPELFYDPARVDYFRRLGRSELERLRFIVYDLIPILHPEYFVADTRYDVVCSYFSMVRRIPHCGFISEWTQQTYYRRLLRCSDTAGRVFRLGSDGLGPKPERAPENRPPHFCVVGAIKRHKNPGLVLDAFEPLLRSTEGLRLTFLGKLDWVEAGFEERLRTMMTKYRGFAWISDAGDDCIRTHVETARATVFVSAVEGFGLPPVESLWLGTPVIASANLPSLEQVGSQGVETVHPLDAGTLRGSVLKFLDDGFAAGKVREAKALKLPTWVSFTQEVAEWCA